MDFNASVWVLLGYYESFMILMGSYGFSYVYKRPHRSLCVTLGFHASLCVLINPISSFWVFVRFLGRFASIWVVMGRYMSLCILINSNGSLWVLMSFHASL